MKEVRNKKAKNKIKKKLSMPTILVANGVIMQKSIRLSDVYKNKKKKKQTWQSLNIKY